MRLVRNTSGAILATACSFLLSSTSTAERHNGHWVSHPRSLVAIVIDDQGGRVSGPEWEYRFTASANSLDFEIAPGRRMVLRRSGENWVGEYFHPRVRPGHHSNERHSMLFVRAKVAAR